MARASGHESKTIFIARTAVALPRAPTDRAEEARGTTMRTSMGKRDGGEGEAKPLSRGAEGERHEQDGPQLTLTAVAGGQAGSPNTGSSRCCSPHQMQVSTGCRRWSSSQPSHRDLHGSLVRPRPRARQGSLGRTCTGLHRNDGAKVSVCVPVQDGGDGGRGGG